MGLFVDATRAALRERPVDVPREPTFEQIAETYPEGRGRNRAIASDAGVSIRTVQRWDAPPGPGHQRRTFGRSEQSRSFRDAGRARLRARAQRDARRRQRANYARAADDGLLYRVVGAIVVSKPPPRYHVMPADVGGRPNPLRVPGYLLETALEQMLEGDDELAEELIEAAFFEAYGLPDVEVSYLEHVGCWRGR